MSENEEGGGSSCSSNLISQTDIAMKLKERLRISRRQHSHSTIRRESMRDAGIFSCLFQYALIPDNPVLPPVCIAGGHKSTGKKISTIEIPQEKGFYRL